MTSDQSACVQSVKALIQEIEDDTNRRNGGGNENTFLGASQQQPYEMLRTPVSSITSSTPPRFQYTTNGRAEDSIKRQKFGCSGTDESISAMDHLSGTEQLGTQRHAQQVALREQAPSRLDTRVKRSRAPSPEPARVQDSRPSRACLPPPRNQPFKRRAIERQWLDSVGNEDYERLRAFRRKERVKGDRYVPGVSPWSHFARTAIPRPRHRPVKSESSQHQWPVTQTGPWGNTVKPSRYMLGGPAGLLDLPEKVQGKILGLLMVGTGPVNIDYSWWLSCVQEHSKIPSTSQEITMSGLKCIIQVSCAQVGVDIKRMQTDLTIAKTAMSQQAQRFKILKAPARGLTPSLLFVSRAIHARVARVFYSGNTFNFPNSANAWVILETFLATIGNTNASYIQHLRIHAPMWHQGRSHDAVEGAVLDSLSTATRLGVIKPLAEDRLLSAIETCTKTLTIANNLRSLQVSLSYPDNALHWISRHLDTSTTMLSLSEVEEHVARKQQGIEMIKQLSVILGPSKKPILSMQSSGAVFPADARTFRSRLATIIREADKYGWGVDQILREPGRGFYRGERFGERNGVQAKRLG